MINRRFLRIKTFQALYAYFQGDDNDLGRREKELFLSLERIYDLYLLFFKIGGELTHVFELKMEEAKQKKLPTEEDKNPNKKFVNNAIFKLFETNNKLNELTKNKKISWADDHELLLKFSNFLKEHPLYKKYLLTKETDFEEDKKFVVDFYKKIIPEYELLISTLVEKSIFWGLEEIDFALSMTIKTIKKTNKTSDASFTILNLYTDKKEDEKFVKDLFRKTIADDKANSKLIADKTKNWDVDRIAMIDILLMKMALTELINFKSVPVKVTFNEYIELTKNYSTQKSKGFVNGILDKLVADLKNEGKLNKMGRGLLES